MIALLRRLGLALVWFALGVATPRLWAGGSALNLVVVVNQSSTNSLQLGNYYLEQRQVPAQNVLRINWAGGNTIWSAADFTTNLYNPLLALLSARQLTNQVEDVVLSMDIPYQVDLGVGNINSTTSALFYGIKPDTNSPLTCPMAPGSTNLYAGSEAVFRATPPLNAASNSFLVTMITASNLALAKQIVDSGVRSDYTFPTQTVYLAKSGDVDRNVRYVLFDNALFNTRLRANYSMQRVDTYGIGGFGTIFGAETGGFYYTVDGTTFVPGSLADNVTSYGGLIFQDSGHLNILSLLQAGAAGTYGTVVEPCNYLEKFPAPMSYFYQARGFTLGECYYLCVTNPYEGLIMGDPLAAPFAKPASGAWSNLPTNALLSGTTNISLQFTASDSGHPLQQVDLFLDGLWLQTLTNIPPRQNDVLTVMIRGQPTNYTVGANETIASVTAGLANALSAPAYTNLTRARAIRHGDRIELQSFDITKTGSQVSVAAVNPVGIGATTFITAARTNLLDTIAQGRHNLVVNDSTTYPPALGAWLLLTVTKTNGTTVAVGVTNTVSGTPIPVLVSNLVNAVNALPPLGAADGCVAQDFIDYSLHVDPAARGAEFNLLANAPGWNAAQIQAALTCSAGDFTISPGGTQPLQDNLPDLQPRMHLYVTAGVTNLLLTFAFNSAAQPDGFHQLTAVAYEGSHVRTQARLTQTVQIRNSTLTATLATLVGGTNAAVETNLQFLVSANTSAISKTELFSTGGLLASVSNQASATFAVAGSFLGIGLHQFYAIVTASSGKQYRTETKWLRISGADSPFPVTLSYPPPTLAWPATAGRSYQVLGTSNLGNAFLPRATVVPSNNAARWSDNGASGQSFYRIRTAP
jgi:uncharacterized protein (TIGR03790 family)